MLAITANPAPQSAAPTGKWLILAGIVGIIAGVCGLAFQVAIDLTQYLFLDLLSGFNDPAFSGEQRLFAHEETRAAWWWLLLVVPLGGLVSVCRPIRATGRRRGHQ